MKNFLLWAALLLAAPSFADENTVQPQPKKAEQRCQLGECDPYAEEGDEDDEEDPLRLPHERAWPYDAELETPTSWPGKREDPFYDWLTH